MDLYIYRSVLNGIRMSTEIHKPTPQQHENHGSIMMYVIGFVLSVAFTIVPYLMVVNKMISGNALIAVILGIGIWQMVIQLTFFLHLGRGPKAVYNVVFFFATVGLIILTIGASLFIMQNLYRNMSPQEIVLKQSQGENIVQIGGKNTGACNQPLNNHIMTIKNGIVTPNVINAKRCDTLTFINDDKTVYRIGFGVYPGDVSYGGEYAIVLDDGRPETITLNEAGTFTFQDYTEKSISGQFTVESQSIE